MSLYTTGSRCAQPWGGVISIPAPQGRTRISIDLLPNQGTTAVWPDIPCGAWRETCAGLHLYTRIIGKYRLARTLWINHSWHATLYVNARCFTSPLVPDGPGGIELELDLIDHVVIGRAMDGRVARFAVGPMSATDSMSGSWT